MIIQESRENFDLDQVSDEEEAPTSAVKKSKTAVLSYVTNQIHVHKLTGSLVALELKRKQARRGGCSLHLFLRRYRQPETTPEKRRQQLEEEQTQWVDL